MSVESLRLSIKELTFQLDNDVALSKTATACIEEEVTLMRLNLNKLESA